MRQELRLSVVTVLGLLVLAAYCGAQPAAKINVLMEVSRKADLEKDWASDRGASFEYTANPGGRVRRTGWAKLTFPARKESEVLFSLPRPAFKRDVWSTYLKIPAEKNIWSGYQTLKVLCYNPSPQATEVGLLLEDLTGLIVGMVPAQDETLRGQMHRATVEVPPGESTISVAIDGKLRTRDDRRWLDIRHVRRVGFNVKGGGAGTVLYVKKLSLESSDKDAGTIAWPSEAKPCPTCAKGADKLEPYYAELGAKGFNDPNAKYCPFCGTQLREQPLEPKNAPGAVKIHPSADACVTSASGGSGDTGTIFEKPREFNELHHYMGSRWEARGLLRFKLDSLPKGAKVKTAQLRLYRGWDKKMDYGKPWFPPLQIHSVPDKYDDWDERVNWLSQPPLGNMLVHGGLYRWRNGTTEWFSYDVTGYVRQQLAGRRVASVALYVMTPYPARKKPHPLGHCIRFPSRRDRDADKRTFLYVELTGD